LTDRTKHLGAVSDYLHKHLLWFLLVAYTAAALWPGPGVWFQAVTLGHVTLFGQVTPVKLPMLLLALMLLNGGLGVQPRARELLHTAPLLAAGLVVNLVLPLAVLFATAQMLRAWPEADEAQCLLVGLALVAAMPVAGSSSAWSQNNNGRLSLSLGLVLLTTLLSPLTMPVSLHAVGQMASGDYANELNQLAALGGTTFLILFIAFPSALGVLGRRAIGDAPVDRIKADLKLVNSVALLALNYANGAVALPQIVAYPDWDFLALTLAVAVLLAVVTFTSGWWLGRLLRADRASCTALMFGLGMSNNGSGMTLAVVALAGYPRVLLPIIFYNLIQHLAAGTATSLLNRGGGPEARLEHSQRGHYQPRATPPLRFCAPPSIDDPAVALRQERR
jgi:BASS family bile acid:Na+ symporter